MHNGILCVYTPNCHIHFSIVDMNLHVVMEEMVWVISLEPGACSSRDRVRDTFPHTREVSMDMGSKEVADFVVSEKVQ